ncbi:hypothetical protein [Acinetobacter rathckeae]|uniref:hypothetical protein n=1 Tax=Acinetobacter rathckeae TaxID=2605272 RepID=UPI0018A2BEDB|nr:hypothetical protein [Acinetobacter rathckeae]MBF7688690.1 hypothetical protein [Acinetobacter rathckeae]MBF7696083.1 hypothetical protein [Acinetobacter rathckeae]
MQYRCPKCQSAKLMPVAQGNGVRPDVPKSLITLIFSIFLLLLLVISSIVMWIFSNGAGTNLQVATVIVFVITVGSGFMFWRDLPKFKASMQTFMQSQKMWKCRECQHQWQN